jgi:UDP-N-acetylmuramyl pentapeptide phosphotransferase/UDP-N-acetylglucosamine-1-phosphate transferase
LRSSSAAAIWRADKGSAVLSDASAAGRAGMAIVAAVVAAGFGSLLGMGAQAAAAAALAAALTAAGMPLFRRYALARPNARSSHSAPIPQGGGAAIVLAAIVVAALWPGMAGEESGVQRIWIAAGALMLVVVGTLDDIKGLPVLPRLGLQFLAVSGVVGSALAGGRGLSPLPLPLEAMVLVVGGVWLVNLTNFIDGIDGITLAGFIPLAAAACVLGWFKLLSPQATLLAVAFLGALCGFVWFNLPRARLFMGDAGSLPIGLLGGALLLDIALQGALIAALILPLYHAADATWTLFVRLIRRERVWEAHRKHAYQRAVDSGWSHGRVSGMVLLLNCGLAGLAVLSTRLGMAGQITCLVIAGLAVAGLMIVFRRRAR